MMAVVHIEGKVRPLTQPSVRLRALLFTPICV